MILRVIRHSLAIDERLSTIGFVWNIEVGIRKNPANIRQFFEFFREFL